MTPVRGAAAAAAGGAFVMATPLNTDVSQSCLREKESVGGQFPIIL